MCVCICVCMHVCMYVLDECMRLAHVCVSGWSRGLNVKLVGWLIG